MGGHGSGGHPAPLKVRQFRRDRAITRREAQPTGDLKEPPAHFDAEMRDTWRYAIESAPAGLLKRLDLSVLEIWCTAYVLHRRALAEIAKSGTVQVTSKGYQVQSPHVAILNRQQQILLKCCDHLGFSPASRSRVAVDSADTCGDWADVATG